MGSDDSLNPVKLCDLIGPDLRATVRGQGEVSVTGDATAAGAIGKSRLLLAVHWAKGQQIRLKLI